MVHQLERFLQPLRPIARVILPISLRNLFRIIRLSMFRLGRSRPYADDYSYQANYVHRVPEHGVILDVASGHNPFPRATILSDRYLEMTAHRRDPIVMDRRPFVILDIHNLPFKTKSVDYIYASHLIEHVDDPERACAELMRVGKAGYIEAPTLMKDALFAWAKEMRHKWYLVQFGNGLVFFEYDERRWEGVRSTKWQQIIQSPYYHPNQDIFYNNLDLFNTILEWTGRFEVTVFRRNQAGPTHIS